MVVKIIEILGVSDKSFEDAVAQGVAHAAKSVRGITGVDVLRQTAAVKDGRIEAYKVDMKVAFVVED